MPEEAFTRALNKGRQIKISVIGRNTGRTITLPVWFVHENNALWLLPVHGSRTQWYQNLLKNPAITITAGKEQRALKAQSLKSAPAVGNVIQSFRNKYTAEMIAKLYPGPLNVAIKVKI
jgi:deazaflavin-dependent oxidoreductase (nitroreductase family)